jgi:hypothetical protein
MFGLGIIGWLAIAVAAAAIARTKNRDALGWFLITGLLPIVGLIIVAVLPSLPPMAPAGLRPVRCPRCNAVQNIPSSDAMFECWQCKLVSEAAGAYLLQGSSSPDRPEDLREWFNRQKDR